MMQSIVGRVVDQDHAYMIGQSDTLPRIIGVPKSDSNGIARLLESGATSWHSGKPVGDAIVLHAEGKPVSAMVMEDRG
ncbi:MAG: hypothetical protein R8J84_06600 [Mariprofundales bacterium]